MNKTTQVLQLNEQKKHSVRYDAAPTENKPPLTSLYLMKTAIGSPGTPPKKILVTIEEVAE